MEQKQVKLIGIRAENHGIIRSAELTPDLLAHKLIAVTGESGNGKSSLLDLCKTAVSGTDAIKKKDALEPGYLAEAQLLDGETPIYIGAKVGEYQRGEKAGQPKFETFLYSKDANGKAYAPIIDGVQAKPSDYVKMLTTELTFSMPDMFSSNQTTHRNFIEKLFSAELEQLGADTVVAEIAKLRKERDTARAMCQGRGAFMVQLESEGYNEARLQMLQRIDIPTIDKAITEKQIERDRILRAPIAEQELQMEKLRSAQNTQMQKLKDDIQVLTTEINTDFEEQSKAHNNKVAACLEIDKQVQETDTASATMKESLITVFGGDQQCESVVKAVEDMANRKVQWLHQQKPDTSSIPAKNVAKQSEVAKLQEQLAQIQNTPIEAPTVASVSTEVIDSEILQLQSQKQGAESTNNVYDRYQLWLEWNESSGKYEAKVDELRKLYAKIDCGVEGMNIVPRTTDSDKVEVWIMYNGQYDSAYYANPKAEMRFMFEYSQFQRTTIGLMLQAARLNLKPKALRLAFVDEVAFTQQGLDMLGRIAEELNLTLMVGWTHEADKTQLADGQVLVEGGEIFFNK